MSFILLIFDKSSSVSKTSVNENPSFFVCRTKVVFLERKKKNETNLDLFQF